MAAIKWAIRAVEFNNCNCSYGCPCQFNGLPTHGHCFAIISLRIDNGHHGTTKLDGLKVVGTFSWPGPIHKGGGEAALVIDSRADDAQRNALLRIFLGKDTKPGATIFQIFSTTLTKVHDPTFADIEFEIDIDKRRARVVVPGQIDMRGEPILNPVTGAEHRVRIDLPNGFEYRLAEIGRGWSESTTPMKLNLVNSYGQFCHVNLSESGVID